MVDIHSHILHKIDDGPETLAEALNTIRMAYRQGIRHMVATPHFKIPEYQNKRVEQAYTELKNAVKTEYADMVISLGNEIYLNEETVKAVKNRSHYTLSCSDYLLIELPWHCVFRFHENMIYEIQREGYKVILAHIERYPFLMDNTGLLEKLIQNGCYTQINASSILSLRMRKKLYKLIEKGLIHIVATDCHDSKYRPPELAQAYESAARFFGEDLADDLFKHNGQAVIDNKQIESKAAGQLKDKNYI